MTTMITHIFLQNYWWIIVSLLGSLLVFLMFVQGGQSFIYTLPQTYMQSRMIINALGRKWEFTFTTLVTFGGAFFASFPLFYATSFGGAYWVWMAILFSFIIQAIAYEYRSKPSNIYGKETFDMFLFINGVLGPFLIGAAVSTFFTGSGFSLNQMNQVKWETSWNGLEALLNPVNLALGFTVLFLARVNGLLFIINTVDDGHVYMNSARKLIMNSLYFLVFFLYFLTSIILAGGYAVDPSTGEVFIEKFKYLHNLLEMPLALVFFLGGVLSVLWGIGIALFGKSRKGIWFTGAGTVAVVFSLFMIAGFNGTSFYPSSFNLQDSLTIRNASSSLFTLKTMMYVSFIIPGVLVYIWFAWRSISDSPITSDEMQSEEHIY